MYSLTCKLPYIIMYDLWKITIILLLIATLVDIEYDVQFSFTEVSHFNKEQKKKYIYKGRNMNHRHFIGEAGIFQSVLPLFR